MKSTVVVEVTRGKLIERRVVRKGDSAQGDLRSWSFRFESLIATQTRCNGFEASEENVCSDKVEQRENRKMQGAGWVFRKSGVLKEIERP